MKEELAGYQEREGQLEEEVMRYKEKAKVTEKELKRSRVEISELKEALSSAEETSG